MHRRYGSMEDTDLIWASVHTFQRKLGINSVVKLSRSWLNAEERGKSSGREPQVNISKAV